MGGQRHHPGGERASRAERVRARSALSQEWPMIDFRLGDEHEALRQTVAEFARDVIAPVIGGYYERGEFPYDIVRQMGQMGLFGLPFPEEYGGMGGDYLALCLALEELGRVDSSVAITLEAGVALGAMPVYRFGTQAQRREWLPRLTSGQTLAAFGLTEAGGGSDVPGGMRTVARLDGGSWVIDGTKVFITNAGTDITGMVTVAAITGARPDGRKEISTIIVPAGTAGFTHSAKYSKVGWLASDTRELSFSGCRVPEANLLGSRGRGYAQFLSTLDEGRVAIGALAVGLAQGCVDECLRYARDRQAFGHSIGTYQAIQFKIADMEVRAHTARLACYAAAARIIAGEDVKKEAAIAKLVASNAAMDNARDATQIFGGYGFMNEFPVGRFYRDAKILEIGEGTSEVQRMVIARSLGL
jgi:alkylation response protein AidB-like acyl-CoA dehydrogenase